VVPIIPVPADSMDLKKFSIGLRPLVDSEAQLRRHILWFIFIRVVLFTLLLGISVLFSAISQDIILPPRYQIIIFIISIYLYSIASAIFLQKRVLRLRRFGLIQLQCDTLFTAILVYFTGCSQSIFPPVFIFPIVAGGLILHRIGGLTPAATATLLFGAILGAEYYGYVPDFFRLSGFTANDNPLAALNIFSVYGLTFFLTALLAGMLAERLRKTERALSRTAHELDKLSILYKQIFDDITTGIITIDEADTITSVNNAAERITGYRAGELIGRRLGRCFPEIVLREKQGRSVADLTRKDNRVIRSGYSFSRLNIPPDPDCTEADCADSKVITLQDISKIERLEKQMRKAEKMATIGEMSASIAHDFRNPLAAISGSAELLRHESGRSSADMGTVAKLSTIIFREAQRMATVVSDFLQFSRPATPRLEWFSLYSLVQDVASGLRDKHGAPLGCSITNNVPENLDIHADRQQLQTALIQLLQNSCEAMEPGAGEVVVTAREGRGDDGRGPVIIAISDQGQGIPSEHKNKIFEPFYTTRESSTGLGLAIVRQIIESHQGQVEISSADGEGCTVTITLPLPQLSI